MSSVATLSPFESFETAIYKIRCDPNISTQLPHFHTILEQLRLRSKIPSPITKVLLILDVSLFILIKI